MTVKQLKELLMAIWAAAQAGDLWGAALLVFKLLEGLGDLLAPAPEGGEGNLKVASNLKGLSGSPAFMTACGKSEDELKAQINALLEPHLLSVDSVNAPVKGALAQELFVLLMALAKKWLGF